MEQIEQARRAVKESPRYKLARAVAGVIGRNPEDLLEKDQLLETAVAETEDRLQGVPIRPSMWTPAHFSIGLVFSKLPNARLIEYNNERNPEEKLELLKNACALVVKQNIRDSGVMMGPDNEVTAQQVAVYVGEINSNLARLTYEQDPARVTDTDITTMVKLLHEQTVASIGQLPVKEPIKYTAYESLGDNQVLARVIAKIETRPQDVVPALKEWDKAFNESRLSQTRSIVSLTNNSRTARRVVDRFEVGRGGNTVNPAYGYPAKLASLPEFSMKVRFSAKLNSATEQALEHIRALLRMSWNNFGTRDAVEFHDKLASDSLKILFARYCAYLVRKSELSTRTRSEDKSAVVDTDYEITKVLLELKQELNYKPPAGKRKKPYFYCTSESETMNGRQVTAFGGQDDSGEGSDEGVALSMYGEPLVNNGTKKQGSGGDGLTGAQLAELAKQDYVFRRFVA